MKHRLRFAGAKSPCVPPKKERSPLPMKHRLRFAGKKLIRMLLLLLGVSLAAFLLMSASPLDPLQTNVGQAALGAMSQEQIAQLEDYWGVNTT